jgi:UDP-3-O-[3-hydroxymyristoyl] glucosamine N-acyltransferase
LALSGKEAVVEWNLEKLAEVCQGRLTKSGDLTIRDALPLAHADTGIVTLVDNAKHVPRLLASKASAVVVPTEFAEVDIPQIVVDNAHLAFETIIQCIRPHRQVDRSGISPCAHVDSTAIVHSSTWIDNGTTIGPGCVIGKRCVIHGNVTIMPDSRIGDDCEIFPGATLYPNTIVGNRVLIHAAAVLGAYGFGYRQSRGRHERTAQMGWVRVDDDVEIGAGTTIDRGTYGPTVIGEGTKIDNQVMIGHNCNIGKHNLICAQVGIAGSSSTGDYVVLGGQVGLRDHIHLADQTQVGAQSGVAEDSKPSQILLGSPAIPHRDQIQIYMSLLRLPEMRKKLRQLENTIEELQKKADQGLRDAA